MNKRQQKLLNQLSVKALPERNNDIFFIDAIASHKSKLLLPFLNTGRFTHEKQRPPQTIKEFADELKIQVEFIILHLQAAGISHISADHFVTENHKSDLLRYLQAQPHSTKLKSIFQQEMVPQEQKLTVEDVNEKMLFLLAQNPKLIYELGSRKFEELVARLFADRGYEVSLTKSTRDGGYDILAHVNDGICSFLVLAECKRYSPNNKVGVEVVRGLYGVTERHRANQGLIITSSFFSRDAQQEQLRIGTRIALKDYNNLVDWLAPYKTPY